MLLAAYELAGLHEARLVAGHDEVCEIDCRRAILVHGIDCYVARSVTPALGAAFMHTETVGAVVDRLAEFSVSAFAALRQDIEQRQQHYAWQRLAELSLGYMDLAFEIGTGRRRVPDCCRASTPSGATAKSAAGQDIS